MKSAAMRNGTTNLFVFLDVHRPWRKVKVTASRTALDFAACMRDLADVHFPKAVRIRVVLDNLSTHSAGAPYQTSPAEEARRLLRRLEFHYVPKHASWLNMVENEIGVLAPNALTAASKVSSSWPSSLPTGRNSAILDVHRPWRKVKVTTSRTALDFVACMRDLADVHFPKAARIRVVLDNLSTHSAHGTAALDACAI